MKDQNEVIREFNEIVNMTTSELESWLKSGDSRSAGWPKEDESGESVGHDSGRKIVEILTSNPDKNPEDYDEDQISHMRKVVSYCKRHLAQEESSNSKKSVEEVKKTKSYASLKNWGHDPLKKRLDAQSGNKTDDGEEGDDNKEEQVGDKRKKSNATQSGSNKKRETRQNKGSSRSNGNDEDEEEEEDDDEDQQDNKGESKGQKVQGQKKNEEELHHKNGKQQRQNGNAQDQSDDDENEADEDDSNGQESSGKEAKKGPQPGETVSWNWGGGNPKGKVLDVKGEKTTITTKRGNKVSKHGDPEDPAVVLDTGKSKAVKANHELN